VLETLELRGVVAIDGAPLFEDLLSSCNDMLRDVTIWGSIARLQERIDRLLRQNTLVRSADEVLVLQNYRIESRALWADVLGWIGSKPTLVMRVLAGDAALTGTASGEPRCVLQPPSHGPRQQLEAEHKPMQP
jgi:hypothetical protein